MALGNYNDNNSKKYYEPLVYSRYGTTNTEGVDPSALSFQFYNRMLKLSIAPMKPNAKPDDRNPWDNENAIAVWLTHTKAKMLHDEIKYAMANPDTCFNAGVTIGDETLVSFSNGKELGVSAPCLIIRKINREDGAVMSVYAYQFKTNFKTYNSVRNYDQNNPGSFDSHTYSNIEIDDLLTILQTYYEASSGAQAYSVLSAMKYDIQKNNTRMELIMEKLGIEKPEYSNGSAPRESRGSFFANNPGNSSSSNSIPGLNGSMRSTTMDDLESEM